MKKQGAALSTLRGAKYENPFAGEPGTFHTYFLIPCLNEDAVIGATVAALAGSRYSTTIVIDDASDDSTVVTAYARGGDGVIVLERQPPNARRGKGEALNDALSLVRQLVAERGQDVGRVLVTVMDADGRLSDGAMAAVLPLFDDPEVGAVQLAVRIRNRERFLTRFQDFHFWSLTSVTQFGRHQSSTVSLGGNGQFSRLSALNEAGETPWSESLTEDLDLSVTLAMKSWKLATTPNAAVEQQGVAQISALFTQRRRWFQGHLMLAKRLPEIWGDARLSQVRALELSAYILTPWVTVLPWSILFHWGLFGLIVEGPSFFSFVTGSATLLIGFVIWYALAFGPVVVSAFVYWRRDEEIRFRTAFLHAHCFPLMNSIAFAAVWSALVRILMGENGWQKTARVREGRTGDPVEVRADAEVVSMPATPLGSRITMHPARLERLGDAPAPLALLAARARRPGTQPREQRPDGDADEEHDQEPDPGRHRECEPEEEHARAPQIRKDEQQGDHEQHDRHDALGREALRLGLRSRRVRRCSSGVRHLSDPPLPAEGRPNTENARGPEGSSKPRVTAGVTSRFES
ncbi:N-acetyl-glucosamine transferase [Leucobacter sp. OAMLP11]|nr:N-acetyl-glucosamine transferase [Leucobacter sp. OAMLP11]